MASFSESSMSSTRRVLVALAFLGRASRMLGLFGRSHAVPLFPAPEREVEGGPLAHLALGPDPAAVPVDDAGHGGQPYARPLELVLPVQPLEGPEQLVSVRLVEAGPVVPHEVGGPSNTGPGPSFHPELYARPLLPLRELPRVAEQVLQGHLEQAHVAVGPDASPRHELHVPLRLGRPPVFYDLSRQVSQVDGLPAQGPAAHPGEVEQVVYERGHVGAGSPD